MRGTTRARGGGATGTEGGKGRQRAAQGARQEEHQKGSKSGGNYSGDVEDIDMEGWAAATEYADDTAIDWTAVLRETPLDTILFSDPPPR